MKNTINLRVDFVGVDLHIHLMAHIKKKKIISKQELSLEGI